MKEKKKKVGDLIFIDPESEGEPIQGCNEEKWSDLYGLGSSQVEDLADENRSALVLGKPGKASKTRAFEEGIFRPELVPSYVKTIHIITNKETGKRYFSYVDTYGDETKEGKDYYLEMMEKYYG